MSAPNKSATEIGTLVFANGNETTLRLGSNRNTGNDIAWQFTRFASGTVSRWNRISGKNIARLWSEITAAVKSGEATWKAANFAAVDALCAAAMKNGYTI